MRHLLWMWLALVALGACAFGGAFLPLPAGLRPLLMLPSLVMVAILALGFMEVRRGGALPGAFALAAIFWLFVLLGLGSADPLTRRVYPADQGGASVPGPPEISPQR
ncbi:MAG: hypothetical protein BGO51_14070 [Rhodospirillales bacterium 69-11]|nr:hypothetical protein [Rhodospirillales bacterium]MBN8926494.1 hypothetical protein [Rhodospirillales bacterium]OJW26536.1 MAG: hypothetical protein BGO51_14070 [Rhodospirillales bacterium 69-11]